MRYTSLAEMQIEMLDMPAIAVTRKDWRTWVLSDDVQLGGHTIPAGFMTDFASIPRPARVLFTPSGAPWQRAAVLHDYLYSSTTMSQYDCDAEYYWQARIDGTSDLAARLQHAALRVGGARAFKSNRRNFKEDPTWRFLT